MKLEVWPGKPYPLGATWDREGTNFALFSENATSVELCLFDEEESKYSAPLTTERGVDMGVNQIHATADRLLGLRQKHAYL